MYRSTLRIPSSTPLYESRFSPKGPLPPIARPDGSVTMLYKYCKLASLHCRSSLSLTCMSPSPLPYPPFTREMNPLRSEAAGLFGASVEASRGQEGWGSFVGGEQGGGVEPRKKRLEGRGEG
eukprot:765793-Hanusia_phi.AAC.2